MDQHSDTTAAGLRESASTGSAPFLLALDDIHKFYGEKEVLHGVSCSVRKGEVLVVVGPSGCGKSTLLRCINGLESIQSGNIALNGKSITTGNVNWPKVRQRIGMVFQSYDLFPHMTVLGNIMLGPIKAQGRSKAEVQLQAETLLHRVGLLDRKNDYPRQLSGGQKQRVAIVRALCMNPEIMLFDEVTASLDPEMVREVLDVMLGLAAQGMTMLIVTHEMAFARAVADKIIFMDEGVIVENAPPQEFFESPQTARAQKFLNTFKFTETKRSASHEIFADA